MAEYCHDMKELIQKLLLKLAAGARSKRLRIEVKQQRDLMLEVINLPSMQRKRIIKKKPWDYRKKMDTAEGQYISNWCDMVKRAGQAIDLIREKEKNPHVMMEELNFHEEPAEQVRKNTK